MLDDSHRHTYPSTYWHTHTLGPNHSFSVPPVSQSASVGIYLVLATFCAFGVRGCTCYERCDVLSVRAMEHLMLQSGNELAHHEATIH